jgi:hypothetical protein
VGPPFRTTPPRHFDPSPGAAGLLEAVRLRRGSERRERQRAWTMRERLRCKGSSRESAASVPCAEEVSHISPILARYRPVDAVNAQQVMVDDAFHDVEAPRHHRFAHVGQLSCRTESHGRWSCRSV